VLQDAPEYLHLTVCNLDTGKQLRASPVPAQLLQLMRGGGLYPVMARQGLIAPLKA